MRKEFIIIISIILIMIIAHIITQNYSTSFFDSLSSDLSKIEERYFNNDYKEKELENEFDKVVEKWEKKYNFLACYIEHDELEKVRLQLVSIKANLMVEDYEKSIDEMEKCKFIMKHIEDKDSLRIINIF